MSTKLKFSTQLTLYCHICKKWFTDNNGMNSQSLEKSSQKKENLLDLKKNSVWDLSWDDAPQKLSFFKIKTQNSIYVMSSNSKLKISFFEFQCIIILKILF